MLLLHKFKPGEVVTTKDHTPRTFTDELPVRTWWQWFRGRPPIEFKVVSSRYEPAANQVGGTYTTIEDSYEGRHFEIPACFLLRVSPKEN